MLSFFPRDVLNDWTIESVSEGFPTYSSEILFLRIIVADHLMFGLQCLHKFGIKYYFLFQIGRTDIDNLDFT